MKKSFISLATMFALGSIFFSCQTNVKEANYNVIPAPLEVVQGQDGAFVLTDGTKMFPNMIGIDPTMGTQLQNPVISEVVLPRGWSGSANKQSAVRGAGQSVKAQGEFPQAVYKKMTKLEAKDLQKIEVPVVSVEEFHENAKRYIETYYVNQNN